MTDIPQEWLDAHPNYQFFEPDGSYAIQLRENDAFPLEVEFLKRSVDGAPRPVKHTFESVSDTFASEEFEGHSFRLSSKYSETVRYLVAYGEEVTYEDGTLNSDYEDRIKTIIWDRDWAKNHKDEGYGAFNEDGSYVIPLPEDSAFPVDVWFALSDENGAYSYDTVYQKLTFTSKDDVQIFPPLPEKPELTPSETPPEGTETGETPPTPDTGDSTPVTPPAPEDTSPHYKFSVYAEWIDRVEYTLPQIPKKSDLPAPQTVTVGTDTKRAAQEAANAKAERRDPLYVTYDEKGEYVINLGDDAFSPTLCT